MRLAQANPDQTALARHSVLAAPGPVFVDRENEGRRLREAILGQESLMVGGVAGAGKTALVSKVIHGLPGDLASRCLYVAGAKDLQDLLRQLIQSLYELGDPRLQRQLHSERISAAKFGAWLKTLPSTRLKGTLYRAVEHGDYRMFLDHLPPLTHPMAKVIKELFWMRNTPVCLLPRPGAEQALERFNHFFYWDNRQRLILGPLPPPAATQLLESCIERFGLSQFNLDGFREEVLDLSKYVPGAIVKMCCLAAYPRYQYGPRIKIKSAYIDYLTTGHDLSVTRIATCKTLRDR
ncbi:MAG TPA: hypothetical protein VMT20_28050 [Terriglobia bacterium]|nr:hypothetical protein [Terriglobia bacterium]